HVGGDDEPVRHERAAVLLTGLDVVAIGGMALGADGHSDARLPVASRLGYPASRAVRAPRTIRERNHGAKTRLSWKSPASLKGLKVAGLEQVHPQSPPPVRLTTRLSLL